MQAAPAQRAAAKAEITAATADGDSVTDLHAAVERTTRAADAARVVGAGDAPEMAPLLARLKAVQAAAIDKADGVPLVDAADAGDREKVASLLAAGMVVRTVVDASRVTMCDEGIVHEMRRTIVRMMMRMTQNNAPPNVIAS